MEKEAAESKRAAKQEGRIGREDAAAKETVIPKGREDILRAKVAKTGVLAALGNHAAARARGWPSCSTPPTSPTWSRP